MSIRGTEPRPDGDRLAEIKERLVADVSAAYRKDYGGRTRLTQDEALERARAMDADREFRENARDDVAWLIQRYEDLRDRTVVKNLRCCVNCGAVTVLARTVDCHLIVIDAEPHADGELVQHGTGPLDDQPVMVHGEPVDDRPRYRRHPYLCEDRPADDLTAARQEGRREERERFARVWGGTYRSSSNFTFAERLYDDFLHGVDYPEDKP